MEIHRKNIIALMSQNNKTLPFQMKKKLQGSYNKNKRTVCLGRGSEKGRKSPNSWKDKKI